MKTKVILTSVLLGLATGCSSIISKSNYPVVINSNPEKSVFEIVNRDGLKVHAGETPATVMLKSS